MKKSIQLLTVLIASLLSYQSFAQEAPVAAAEPASAPRARILPSIRFREMPSQNLSLNFASVSVSKSAEASQCTKFEPSEKYLELLPSLRRTHCEYEQRAMSFGYRNTINLTVREIKESGLKLRMDLSLSESIAVKVKNQYDENKTDFAPIYQGEFQLSNCYKGGQPVMTRSNSLADVFQKARNNLENGYDYCVLTSRSMQSSYVTANSDRPFDYMENVRIELRPEAVKIRGTVNGKNFELPFLYYTGEFTNRGSGPRLQGLLDQQLDILDQALATIESEKNDVKIPQTVAFLLNQRGQYESNLQKIQTATFNATEFLNFLVTIKNSFFILDQAVGLASKNQISLGSYMGVRMDANGESAAPEKEKSKGWFSRD